MAVANFTELDGVTVVPIECSRVLSVRALGATELPPGVASGSLILADGARYAVQGQVATVSATVTLNATAREWLYGVAGADGPIDDLDLDTIYVGSRQPLLCPPEEFLGPLDSRWSTLVSGAGASNTIVASELKHEGVMDCSTGTTNAGRAGSALGSFATSLRLDNGITELSFYVQVDTLSTVGEEFQVYFGAINQGGARPTRGVYFRYDRLATGVNWFAEAVDGGAYSSSDTQTAVDTGWHRFDILVDESGTPTARFYIDGVLVATITSANIPTTSAAMALAFHIMKTAGTTPRILGVDFCAARKTLNGAGR